MHSTTIVSQPSAASVAGLTRARLAAWIAFGWLAFGLLVGLGMAFPATASAADPGDVGFDGPAAVTPSPGAAPSGSKPESKLWFNDGSWWGSLWDVSTGDFYIWRLDRTTHTWVRTGTRLDDRSATRADVLWDGTKLFVASHNFSESDGTGTARLYRYSYDAVTDTYALDAGFPATINSVRSETLVIAKDSTGQLWATWEQGLQIWVNRTLGSDAVWGTPFVVPAALNVKADDISSIIAFGGDKIGIYWSNQAQAKDYFAIHSDSQVDTTWLTPEVVLSGSGIADDHMNLKTDASGKVYAVVKTSLGGASPLIKFVVRATNGSWTNFNVGTGTDAHTRAILIVDEAHSLFRIYMTLGQAGGPIVEKTSSMSSISFPTGLGTTVMLDVSANKLNNPSSTKQNVTSETGLIILAFNDTTKVYWHADIFGGAADTTAPTVTTKTPAALATDVSIGTNVTATFSEDVTGVSGSTFTLQGPGATPVAATVTYDALTRTATLDPTSNLNPSVVYTARLLAGITDLATNPLAPVSWTFTTAAPDTIAPTVTTKTPAASATDVSIGTNVTATFSEDVTGVGGSTFTLEGPGATPVAASVTYDALTKTATLDPTSNLNPTVVYTARLLAGIADSSANPLAPVTWTFTTAAPSAGISFRSASSASNTTTTTLVIPAPAGVVTGDVLLASVAARGAPTFTAPSGWTLVRLDPNGSTLREASYVHVAGGSEPATYTWTLSGAQSAAGGISAYIGVDTASPIDTSGGQINVSSVSITAPSIATTGPDRVVVGLFATAVLTTVTPPAGEAERYDQTVPSTNSFKITAEAADQTVAAAGATGTRVATSAKAGVNIGQLVALRPTAAAPNNAPVVTNPGTQTNAENDSVSLQIVANDLDLDTLTYSATGLPTGLSINPSTGLITGAIAFTAAAGSPYSVTVGASDGSLSDSEIFSWTVTNTNRAPVATIESYSTPKDTPLFVSAPGVLGNDSDPDGDSITAVKINDPGAGASVTLNANGSFTYNPAPGVTGPDSFTYQATDGLLNSATTTVSITVTAPAASGITFRSASSASNTTTTTLVIPTPAGVVTGDVLLTSVTVRGAPTITPPAGWTLVRLDVSGSTVRQAIYVRVAGGSEPASYTFTLSNAQSAAGGIVAYSGVNTATPVDIHGGQVNVSSASITAPSIATTVAGDMLVGFFGTASLTTVSPPASMTERFDRAVPSTNTFKVTLETADQIVSAAGAVGTRVALAANAAANIGQLVALKPAP